MINTDRKSEMHRLRFDERWTLQKIAEHFNISKQRVSLIIGKSGHITKIDMRDKVAFAKKSNPSLSLTELAQEFGVGERTIRNILNSRGIDCYVPKKFEFWKWVRIGTRNDCWTWLGKGGNHKKGYGTITVDHKQVYTHRLAYELSFGPIPNDLWVLHKCDNPPCCNPSHLFLGTPMDNVLDSISKGRR